MALGTCTKVNNTSIYVFTGGGVSLAMSGINTHAEMSYQCNQKDKILSALEYFDWPDLFFSTCRILLPKWYEIY